MAGWNHDSANWKLKKCAVCEAEFVPRSGVHKFCSEQCKGKWKYITGAGNTEAQYGNISGNWQRYYCRLRSRSPARSHLSIGDLLSLHEKQGGRCALSGAELTCTLIKGERCWSNASIDRVVAGGPYTLDNIHLVCVGINTWRGVLPVEDFIRWCTLVAEHNKEVVNG